MESLNTPNEHELLRADNERLRSGLKELQLLFVQQHKHTLSRIKQLLKTCQPSGEVSYQDTSDPSTWQGAISQTLPAGPGRVFTRGAGGIVLASSLIMDRVSDNHPLQAHDTESSTTLQNNRNDISSHHSNPLDKSGSSFVLLTQLIPKIVVDDGPDCHQHRFNIFSPRLEKSCSLPLLEKNKNKRAELSHKSASGINTKYKISRVGRLASYLGKEGCRVSSNQLKM